MKGQDTLGAGSELRAAWMGFPYVDSAEQQTALANARNDAWYYPEWCHEMPGGEWNSGEWNQCVTEGHHEHRGGETLDVGAAARPASKPLRLQRETKVACVSYEPPPRRRCFPGSHNWTRTAQKETGLLVGVGSNDAEANGEDLVTGSNDEAPPDPSAQTDRMECVPSVRVNDGSCLELRSPSSSGSLRHAIHNETQRDVGKLV